MLAEWLFVAAELISVNGRRTGVSPTVLQLLGVLIDRIIFVVSVVHSAYF